MMQNVCQRVFWAEIADLLSLELLVWRKLIKMRLPCWKLHTFNGVIQLLTKLTLLCFSLKVICKYLLICFILCDSKISDKIDKFLLSYSSFCWDIIFFQTQHMSYVSKLQNVLTDFLSCIWYWCHGCYPWWARKIVLHRYFQISSIYGFILQT